MAANFLTEGLVERVAASYGQTLCNFFKFTGTTFVANTDKTGCTNFAIGGGRITYTGAGASAANPLNIGTQMATYASAASFSATDLVIIDGGGNGHFTYADVNACPSCPAASVRRAVATFVLTSVWGNTANGNILTDTGQGGNAGPISATLVPQPYGPTIQLNAGPASGVYCPPAVAKNCGA